MRHEGATVLGDTVDRDQQFAHRGHDRDLAELAASDQALVVRAQPGMEADRAECGHPKLGSQSSVPERMQAGAMSLTLAGLPEAGHGANERGKRAGAAELGRVADPGDQASRRLRPDAWDRRQEFADIVSAEQTLDIALHGAEAATPEVEVFAGIADLQTIGLAVVLADRGRRRGNERLGQCLPHAVAPVNAQPGQNLPPGLIEGFP